MLEMIDCKAFAAGDGTESRDKVNEPKVITTELNVNFID